MFTNARLVSPADTGSILVLHNDLFDKAKLSVHVWVDDQGPVQLRGNKWPKLKYNLEAAAGTGYKTLLTFGGAFSNHIAATACAAKMYDFQSIGIIRGEGTHPLNKTLTEASQNGMDLHFISREQYRKKDDPDFIAELRALFGDFYLIPEGGSNHLAIQGCREWMRRINGEYDFICCACGTGATLAGMVSTLSSTQKAIGFNVLREENYLKEAVQRWLAPENSEAAWEIQTGYHFGGYAKSSPELIQFVNDFSLRTGITIEPVYTGKMFFGLTDLIRKNYFQPGSSILAIHTGGLQYLDQ